jgi:N-acetylneuraminate synthase
MIQLSNGRMIGPGQPVFIIAEIGINHNGSLDIAKSLIDKAVECGCDAVKFQKRTPELCVPLDQRDIERDTPWGRMTYMEYRYKVEFEEKEYAEIDEHCRKKGIFWFASPWDEGAVDFLQKFNVPMYKTASASLTDYPLLERIRATGIPLMMSTGMSTWEEIEEAVAVTGTQDLMLAHATSAYPCEPTELNLRVIRTLMNRFPEVPIGYSGHETGLATTLAAVAVGATFVERHFTLDRAMWGSDQAASVEPGGMAKLVRDIRDVEIALGDGVKQLYPSEMGPRKKLRRVQ